MSDSSDDWLTLRGYRTVLELGPADPAARHRPDDPPFRLSDFDLLREVGRGGMGVVYEAVQRSLGRRVAVKVLTRAALLDDSARRRFQHEARVAAFVPHPNVVPVFHAGEEDGVPFFVMPLVSGTSLAGVLDAARDNPDACRLPRPGSAGYFATVARLAADAARALQAAPRARSDCGRSSPGPSSVRPAPTEDSASEGGLHEGTTPGGRPGGVRSCEVSRTRKADPKSAGDAGCGSGSHEGNDRGREPLPSACGKWYQRPSLS